MERNTHIGLLEHFKAYGAAEEFLDFPMKCLMGVIVANWDQIMTGSTDRFNTFICVIQLLF